MNVRIENLGESRFECVFPVCGGICCRNGRPGIEAEEEARIREHLPKFLPHLRPEARRIAERGGWLTHRRKEGLRTLAVTGGWCVFHNEGCVLHKVGATEGEKFRYKPWRCAVFPLAKGKDGSWYVRQWGLKGEAWDLFCLNPKESPLPGSSTLAAEIDFVEKRRP